MSTSATPITSAAVETQTRAWLQETFLYMQGNSQLRSDTALLSGGVIDSVGVIELVEFLQSTFDVTIADNEITEANLGCLASISQFVEGKCRRKSSQSRPRIVA